jgi:PAS domain S-box-containing protein
MKGILHIPPEEVRKFIRDPNQRVNYRRFDYLDGFPGGPQMQFTDSSAVQTSDGRLWFGTDNGLAVVDPAHLVKNTVPPPVSVESISNEKGSQPISDAIRFAAGTHTVEIHYSALSFSIPERVKFRYRLGGVDTEWQNVDTRRQAYYYNLAPGRYQFRVTACNNDGVWNSAGASLDFTILPAYYQTNWFRGLCVAALLALLWVAYQVRARQLQEQERRFREAVETMPALAFIARPDSYRTFVNRGWVEYTGLTLEQASGSGWQVALHPDDLNRVVDEWKRAAATGEPLEYETRLRRGVDGEYRWFQTRVKPLRDKHGKVVKWCGVATDIEDRRRAERENKRLRELEADLAHINRVSILGELAASIAHEVNQPLSGVVSNANAGLRWLTADVPNAEEVREGLRRIIRDGKRAADVIARIRTLTRRAATTREKLDLNETIRDVLALVGDEAKKDNVEIRTQFADEVPSVAADRVQLQQVVLNLVMNAIEAMSSVDDRARELVITTRNTGPDQVEVTVEDSGIGIDAQSADKIFDSFYTTKPGGMGMGLSISRSILQAHGGRLWATARNGTGTIFSFTLPTGGVPGG